jgi:hypothetical protein
MTALRSLLRLLLVTTTTVVLIACGASIKKGDPRWDPPTLSKTGCPDIDGTYYVRDQKSENDLLWSFIPYHAPDNETNPTRMVSHFQRTQKMAPRKKGSEHSPGTKTSKKPAAQIKKAEDNFLELRTIGSDGKPRSEYLLDLKHPWVGCHNGALVVRRWVLIQAPKGPCGFSRADETEFRKLPDGSLQLNQHTRWWECDMDREPRHSRATFNFPAAK